jgi:hydrogenase maturation protease
MQHVLCFGNLWHGDDGFGIHVGRRLRERLAARPDVRVVEVGLRGLDALPLFDGCRRAILVDALHDPSLPPGTIRRLPATAIPVESDGFGHAAGVGYLLRALAAARGGLPPATLVGAVIERIRPFSDTLSPLLVPAVEAAVDAVVELLDAGDASEGRG